MESMERGGAEKTLLTLLSHLHQEQYEIHLLLHFDGGFYQKELPSFVNVNSLFSGVGLLSRATLFFSRRLHLNCFYQMLVRPYRTQKYDTIISFMEGFPVLLHSLLMKAGKEHISWVHTDLLVDHWTTSLISTAVETKTYEQMNQLFFVSQCARVHFRELFPSVSAKLALFNNPIPRDQIRQLASEGIDLQENSAGFTIVSVGRLTIQKSFDRLIEAVSLLKRKGYDVKLRLIGDGVLRTTLQQQIQDLQLENEVHLYGFYANPYPLVASSALFVSSSYVEGYPLAICEALCLGIPVVATDTAGSDAILEGGKYGLIVAHTAASIADGIESLLQDRTLYRSYVEKAALRGESFAIDNVIKAFETVLNGESHELN